MLIHNEVKLELNNPKNHHFMYKKVQYIYLGFIMRK